MGTVSSRGISHEHHGHIHGAGVNGHDHTVDLGGSNKSLTLKVAALALTVLAGALAVVAGLALAPAAPFVAVALVTGSSIAAVLTIAALGAYVLLGKVMNQSAAPTLEQVMNQSAAPTLEQVMSNLQAFSGGAIIEKENDLKEILNNKEHAQLINKFIEAAKQNRTRNIELLGQGNIVSGNERSTEFTRLQNELTKLSGEFGENFEFNKQKALIQLSAILARNVNVENTQPYADAMFYGLEDFGELNNHRTALRWVQGLNDNKKGFNEIAGVNYQTSWKDVQVDNNCFIKGTKVFLLEKAGSPPQKIELELDLSGLGQMSRETNIKVLDFIQNFQKDKRTPGAVGWVQKNQGKDSSEIEVRKEATGELTGIFDGVQQTGLDEDNQKKLLQLTVDFHFKLFQSYALAMLKPPETSG